MTTPAPAETPTQSADRAERAADRADAAATRAELAAGTPVDRPAPTRPNLSDGMTPAPTTTTGTEGKTGPHVVTPAPRPVTPVAGPING